VKKFDSSLKEIRRQARQDRISAMIDTHSKTAESPTELLEKSLQDWVDAFMKVLPERVLKEMLEGKDNKEAMEYIDRLMSLLDVPVDQADRYWGKIKEALGEKQPQE